MKHFGERVLNALFTSTTTLLELVVPFNSALITDLDITQPANGSGDTVFDILKNGISVYGSPTSRPKILSGQTSVHLTGLTFAASKGDILVVQVATIPTGGVGNPLRVVLTLDDQVGTAPNLSWRSQWKTATNYFMNDIVLYANNAWIALATSNSINPPSDPTKWELFAGLFVSPEQVITDLYSGAYARAPTAPELAAGVASINGALTSPLALRVEFNTLALDNLNSSTYIARGRTDSQFVDDLYNGLLGREPDTAGHDFWKNKLTTSGGTFSRAQLITAFVYSVENVNIRLNTISGTVLPYGDALYIQGVAFAGGVLPTSDGDYPAYNLSTGLLEWRSTGGLAPVVPDPSGTYGSVTKVPRVTIDIYGRTTAVVEQNLDYLVSSFDFKASVRVSSTANVNISSAPSSIDGVTLTSGDSVLLKNQTTASQNGIYVFNGAAAAMTRRADADSSADVTAAMIVPVEEGTANADTFWLLTTNNPITLGTTSLVFTQFGSSGSPSGSAGGDLAGTYPNPTVAVFGGASQGDILYRGASAWTRLSPGTAGLFLKTGGAGANPSWDAPSAPSGGGIYSVDGRPLSASSQDDEFNGTTLDAKWTAFNSGVACTVSVAKSLLHLNMASQASDQFTGIFQPVPAGDWTIITKIINLGSYVNYHAGGLALLLDPIANPTTTALELFSDSHFAGGSGVHQMNVATRSAQLGSTLTIASSDDSIITRYIAYQKIVKSGTTYSFYWSRFGYEWTLVASGTAGSGNMIATPGYFGFWINNVSSGVDHNLYFDYFRLYATDPALIGEVI